LLPSEPTTPFPAKASHSGLPEVVEIYGAAVRFFISLAVTFEPERDIRPSGFDVLKLTAVSYFRA
jgi:hypothetical protein